ncbi:hypothetical protein acdb102_27030 [Acidothermaceae bacterium B102]|nr:hypothetical protein acdb102_27030 [Acidothermaceae bacterium B102]
MVAETVVAALAMLGVAIGIFSLIAVYAPRTLTHTLDARKRLRRLVTGPVPEGRPIQQIADDLRRALHRHDQLLRNRSEWYVTHEVRVSERDVHDLAEEAAGALGLEPCPATVGTWTTTHLAVRLRQLSEAGLTVPDLAWRGDLPR